MSLGSIESWVNDGWKLSFSSLAVRARVMSE